MKVFKYLVALADISVGFLGLFFVIFTVTRPTLSSAVSEKRRLERDLQQLREEIRQLQEIKLAKAGAARQAVSADAAKIIVTGQALTVELAGRQTRFAALAAFAAAAQNWRWPASVVLYVDHRVPFQQVVGVIDALKRNNDTITVQIAALAQ
jgi:biopolymer transport protein ExbD